MFIRRYQHAWLHGISHVYTTVLIFMPLQHKCTASSQAKFNLTTIVSWKSSCYQWSDLLNLMKIQLTQFQTWQSQSTSVPCVPTNTPTKCERDWVNCVQELQRTQRHVGVAYNNNIIVRCILLGKDSANRFLWQSILRLGHLTGKGKVKVNNIHHLGTMILFTKLHGAGLNTRW